MARLKLALAGIITCLFAVFLMSDNIYASSIDLTNSNNISVNGFCANNTQYYSSALYYTPSSVTMDYYITKSFTDNGYNQFLFDSAPCSGAWGINSIDLYMDDSYGWEVDGKFLNVDIISNNYSMPFFNGAVVYAFDGGSVVPGLIDSRTYDIKLQASAYDWYSGRDQAGAEYSYKFDEVEITQGSPSVQTHLQFSIPYIAENFTSNGVSNISMGTSQYVGTETDHYQRFGYTSSPFFYTEDPNITGSTMFWVYISVSDEAEFDSVSNKADAWEETRQYYNNEYAAIDDISGQNSSDLDIGNSQTATNLIGYITNFIGYIGNISPASDCNIELQFPNYAGGTMTFNLCQFKDNFGNIITVFSSLVLIVFYIPLAYKMLSVIYSEIRSFTNG